MQTVTLPQIEIDPSILLSLKNSADELAYKMKLYTIKNDNSLLANWLNSWEWIDWIL
jgi:hypothetical protein